MPWLIILMRRLVLLALLGAVGSVLVAWLRGRNEAPAPAPPQWPPLDSTAATKRAATSAGTQGAATEAEPTGDDEPTDATEAPTTTGDDEPADSAEVDAPSGNGGPWVPPGDDGSCPVSHPIKANDNSMIFHVPGGRFYDRTVAERCYATEDAASADGYRRSKS